MKKGLLLFVYLIIYTSVYSETITLNIDNAIDMLHRNNMNLQAEAFNIKISGREKKTAWNMLLPTMKVSAGTTYMDNPGYIKSVSDGFGGYISEPSGPNQPRFGLELGIAAGINLNYALGAGLKNYTLKHEAGEISFEKTLKFLEMKTKIRFYTLLNLKEQIKIMEKGIDLAEKRYIHAQKNYTSGLIQELDVLRTQVAYESQKPAYSNLLNEYKNLL